MTSTSSGLCDKRKRGDMGRGGEEIGGEDFEILLVKRDHCTALLAVQHPSMTPTSFLVGWGE